MLANFLIVWILALDIFVIMAQNKGDFDVEMEYVNEEIEFLLEGNILQNKRPKQVNITH